MIYDFTQNPPRAFIDEGEGHIVDARVLDAMKLGKPVFYESDENGHAAPIFEKEF